MSATKGRRASRPPSGQKRWPCSAPSKRGGIQTICFTTITIFGRRRCHGRERLAVGRGRMRVAVLGMGAMGSRMALSLLKAGHSVVVWNRTPGRATHLIEQGASVAATPYDAAKDADIVLSVVRDNEASRRVWLSPDDGALMSMSAGAIGIESSTLTPNCVRELASTLAARGIRFLDAPVVGTRAQADAMTLIHLVGGDEATMVGARPVLSAIGNVAHHVG